MLHRFLPAFALLAVTGATAPAFAGDKAMTRSVRGPVSAELVRVVDGDTLLVDAMPWPQQNVRVYVRLRGIDAPELHAHCAALRSRAHQARRTLARLVAGSGRLVLNDISGGKYFGRVLAEVETADGTDLSESMLASRLVSVYSGGRRHWPACDRLAAGSGF